MPERFWLGTFGCLLALGCSDAGATGSAGTLPDAGGAAGASNNASAGALGPAGGAAPVAGASALGGSTGQAGSGQAGMSLGQAGMDGGPGLLDCGAAEPGPEPPATPPDPVSASSGAVTTLKHGDVDEGATNVNEISAGAGMTRGDRSGSSVWKSAQPGAYLEYTVSAVTAGTYSINAVYFSQDGDGKADVLVNGTKAGSVTFDATKSTGGYGGIPNGFSRGPGTVAALTSGTNEIRLAVWPTSTPLEVVGLQLNYAGHELPSAGQPQRLSTTGLSLLPTDVPSDFYRMNYDPQRGWPCQRTFCLVEYLVEAPAGKYELRMKYSGASQGGCSGVRFFVNGQAQGELALPQGSGTTEARTLELPCGVSRISVKNANYLTGGEYCGYGADYGAFELTPVP